MATKEQEIFHVAQQLFRQNPDWVTFFREVLGLGGIVRQVYRSAEQYAEFEQTDEFKKIQQMIGQLRKRRGGQPEEDEPVTVITVRLPKSLHDTLRVEAQSRSLSMNKLCIAKLLQALDEQQAAEEADAASRAEAGRTESNRADGSFKLYDES